MICLNCHTEFEGAYCPQCGQSAKTQRFSVRNVMMATLEVWGMGNRSLPRTVWHLFSRPGYMIGDYLDGKRIAFFPPVKLLFVLCVFYAVVVSLLGYDNPSDVLSSLTVEGAESQELANATLSISGHSFSVKSLTETAYHLLHWLDNHKAIELIGLHCFFMLFAWRVFRKAPSHPQTTLAENFFAQVFISCQMMALSIVYLPIFGRPDTLHNIYPLPSLLLFALFAWDYKQLFGYSWRKTIKCTLLVHLYTFIVFILVVAAILGVVLIGADTGPATQ